MTVGIEFKRSIAVRCFRFVGTVAQEEPRSELVAVVKAINELGGEIEASALVGYLIPEGLDAAAVRLLEISRVLGLVKAVGGRFTLTEKGTEAAKTERVLVPMQGAWLAWIAADPMLRFPLLHVQATRPLEAKAELQPGGANAKRLVDPPKAFRDLLGKRGSALAKSGRVVVLDDLGAKVYDETSLTRSVQLCWTIRSDGSADLKVRGNLNTGGEETAGALAVDAAIETPNVRFDDIFSQVLKDAGVDDRWDSSAGLLRCSFESAKAAKAIHSMRRGVAAGQVDLTMFGLGQFKDVIVGDVPVTARNDAEASPWSQRRLIEGVKEYQTTTRYLESVQRAREPFGEFKVELPDRERLLMGVTAQLKAGSRRPDLYWRLQAPSDWGI